MYTNKKTMPFLIPILLLTALLSGCPFSQPPMKIVSSSDSSEKQNNVSVSKRFQESSPEGPTAVESAIELSEKYAKLAEETAVLRQKNQSLSTENNSLKEQTSALDVRLKQTEKELSEATSLLRDMLVELNNWKADIIGFRDEMREAEQAQLESLLKILKILGGEVKEEPVQNKDAGRSATSSIEPNPSKIQKSSVSGEPNE